MKKVILFLLVSLSWHIDAQEFHFLPKAGLNISSFTNSEELDSRVGLHIGLGVELSLTPKFSVESGLFYSMQGQRKTFPELYIPTITQIVKYGGKVEFYMDYLNIPVYAKYYAYKGLYFFGGPQFGFNIASKLRFGNFDGSDEVKKMIRKFDLGLGIGTGYQFDMGLFASVSYTYGLIGIVQDGKEVNGVLLDTKGKNGHNSVFQFGLGWRF